jgi:hypothetical protein
MDMFYLIAGYHNSRIIIFAERGMQQIYLFQTSCCYKRHEIPYSDQFKKNAFLYRSDRIEL